MKITQVCSMQQIKMIRVIVPLLLISSIWAYPSQTPKNPGSHKALLRYLHRRSIGCYSGCSSCNSCSGYNYASCPSTCNSCIQDCCQNNCQVCQQPVCHQNDNCGSCCNRYCPTTTTSTTTITTVVPTITTSTVRPTFPTPTPVLRNKVSNSSVDVKNTVVNSLTNVVSNNNTIHVPVTINNVNRIHISERIYRGSSQNRDPIILTTPRPSSSTVRPTSRPETDQAIIILIPYQGYYVQPVVDLPCMNHGYSCGYRRTYWTGSVCGGCSGCGQTWGDSFGGYSSGHNWGASEGCRTVTQNCGLCGQDFYNSFARGTWQFNSCYGCFV